MRRGLVVLALLSGAAALLPAAAQQPSLSVTVAEAMGTARVHSTALLADGKYVSLMRSGFPLRLHFRLELWHVRSSWFDQFVREASWDAVVRHDPLTDDFVLVRTGGSTARYATVEDLARALEIPYRVTLPPRGSGGGRFYFVCRLDLTTLNDTDLEEVTRWLKGDVGPAVAGSGSVGGALSRGAQRVLVRIAGLPRLTLEGRSAQFRPAR
ncbi:MAG: DUF4390 domain-containing protein [Gemmatimonadetes bacterium]|nr:DUF4390 domain-containing protein [Gemmatimonadota bacterium]